MPTPVALIILDGFGVAPQSPSNAITSATTPYLNFLKENYPVVTLRASGEAVGLPWGEMGNSEVGHLTIGAGKILYQSLPRINRAISDGTFYSNKALENARAHVQQTGGKLHILGLFSPGGVHSHQDHGYALINWCENNNVPFAVHAFLDGRDMPFDSGKDFIRELVTKLKETKGILSSISGRFYAMDRDNHWDRTLLAYGACLGAGQKVTDPLASIMTSYANAVYDEQFFPITVCDEQGNPLSPIQDGDSIVFFNFRADRARQLTKLFVLENLPAAPHQVLHNIYMVTMTEFETGLPVEIMFPPESITMPLAKVLSDANKKQLHIAETEKYAHVTFFFNGGKEEPFPGEDRILIPSPKVTSYDVVPEMSAIKIADELIKNIARNYYDFFVVNFANPDMVGHTGNLNATIEAIEVIDEVLKRVVEAFLALDGTVFITGDHGNAEEKRNIISGEISKEHTTNPVPLYMIQRSWFGKNLPIPDAGADLALVEPVGFLADVAPTILHCMHIPIPSEMTGSSLIP